MQSTSLINLASVVVPQTNNVVNEIANATFQIHKRVHYLIKLISKDFQICIAIQTYFRFMQAINHSSRII